MIPRKYSISVKKMRECIHPDDIIVWYVIPALRRHITIFLNLEMGLSAKKISKILETSVATISHYKNKKRGFEIFFPIEIVRDIGESAMRIGEDPSCYQSEIQKLIRIIRKTKILCEFHQHLSHIDENCEICKD